MLNFVNRLSRFDPPPGPTPTPPEQNCCNLSRYKKRQRPILDFALLFFSITANTVNHLHPLVITFESEEGFGAGDAGDLGKRLGEELDQALIRVYQYFDE